MVGDRDCRGDAIRGRRRIDANERRGEHGQRLPPVRRLRQQPSSLIGIVRVCRARQAGLAEATRHARQLA